jgi:ABC-type bacteriocin/lantibiotic exporter with double-glycine peptidase domain
VQRTINRRTAARIQVLRELSIDIVSEAVDQVPEREEATYRSRVDQVYRLNMQVYRRKFTMNFSMNLLHHLGIVGVFFIGGWRVIHDRTELGTVVAFISGLNRINDPWNDLVTYFRDMTNARVKYRLIGVLNDGGPEPAAAERRTAGA